MQGVKKPGGRDLASGQTVLGSTQLEQLQMQDNHHITDAACQSKMDTCANQSVLTEARRQVAKLAYIDAVLASISMPPGFRSLTPKEVAGEVWETPMPEFLLECLQAEGVTALIANRGTWWIDDLWVCSHPMFGISAEHGWMRWILPSLDGIVRESGKGAPWVTRSPAGTWFWCEKDKKALRVTLGQMLDRCVDWMNEVRP